MRWQFFQLTRISIQSPEYHFTPRRCENKHSASVRTFVGTGNIFIKIYFDFRTLITEILVRNRGEGHFRTHRHFLDVIRIRSCHTPSYISIRITICIQSTSDQPASSACLSCSRSSNLAQPARPNKKSCCNETLVSLQQPPPFPPGIIHSLLSVHALQHPLPRSESAPPLQPLHPGKLPEAPPSAGPPASAAGCSPANRPE